MSYQVLARKWRPHSFDEMVGQEHVVRALSNALDNDRLHHAYLFTGTRGVGKTTLARILAKSLNCEQGVSSTPCGQCSICQEVDAGRFADLMEVDAASRTKVDQTLELLENVPFAPIRGRYKVYLIDEVHMFSKSSFNALLKTLEEPPAHVKFLLATTDPQKVPVTVLSRCLQLNLKRLPLEQIRGHFEYVLEKENIGWEAPALDILSRVADGSMRDGLSILDQAISFGGGTVREADVITMLGVAGQDQLPLLLRKVAENDAEGVLGLIRKMAEMMPDYVFLLKDLLLLLHRIAWLQTTPAAADASWGDIQPIQELAQLLPPEDVQLFYEIALRGQNDLPLAPDHRSGFEMILLRMLVFKPDTGRNIREQASNAPVSSTAATPVQSVQPQPPEARQLREQTAAAQSKPDITDWHKVLPLLNISAISAQLAAHCTVKSWDGKKLLLQLNPEGSALAGSTAEKKLKNALQQYLDKPLELSFEVVAGKEETPAQKAQREAREYKAAQISTLQQDPLVQELENQLGGELLLDSIEINSQKPS